MDSHSFRDQWGGRLEAALGEAVPKGGPQELYGPARYVLEGGGKRIRPLLTVLSAELLGGQGSAAVPAGVAVEVFHNFTLVHDDIMDHADSRRGRATVHKKWDEPTAILVGDLLMGLAYEQLGTLAARHIPDAIQVFSRMVKLLCEGQSLDMAFESRSDVSMEEYLGMIERKTGALLACAMELGAVVANSSLAQRDQLAETGMDIGRAFQIQDDLLDLTAADAKWGKKVGGDLLEGKRTYLTLLAKERLQGQEAELLGKVFQGKLTEEEIPKLRNAMKAAGVLKESRDAVIFHSNAAIQRLEAAPHSPARTTLVDLVHDMQKRIH